MKDEGNKTNINLLLQALIVGICTGIVVGLFRFGIETNSAFWLHFLQLDLENPLWLIAIMLGLLPATLLNNIRMLVDLVFQK